jgi:ribosomal protein S18 acetylase RimI-like enzyme
VIERDRVTLVDVVDGASFARLPPCADPRFDHRSCDYWEDDAQGAKTARPAWWQPASQPETPPRRPRAADNPFARDPDEDVFNPFAPTSGAAVLDPLAGDDLFAIPADNPFAPAAVRRVVGEAGDGEPRKLRLLRRGLHVFGSYAKLLLVEDEPAVYAQFGPLSAYPRARKLRELYPRLPQSPLPAVITCVATASGSQGRGLARRLVEAICEDLSGRGFSAVEAYPDLTLGADEASAAHPAFWRTCGFEVAVDDERYPVLRRALE